MNILEINADTQQVIEREMTEEEIAQRELDEQQAANKIAADESKEISKAALLARLGLTAEEAALLLQ
jgi:hypothetical protein